MSKILMRFIFCVIPSILVALIAAVASQDAIVASICGCGMFGLGWQVTAPVEERGEGLW